MRAQEFIVEYKISARKHRKGVTVVATDDKGKQVGIAELEYHLPGVPEYEKTIQATRLSVEPKYQRQGIAQAMYDLLKSRGYKIIRSGDQTFDGAKFWNKHRGKNARIWEQELSEISDERLQDYLSRAGRQVDARQERMARVRDRLNKGYEIYHADAPNKVVDRFEARTPVEAQRYYNDFISKYESDVDYDLRLRRATGIMEVAEGLKDDIKLSHNMSPDMLYVHATIGDSDAGGARFKKIDGAWTGDIVHVYPQFRRQGVATKIYDYAEDLVGKIIPSKTLKSKGKKFWANRDKQDVAESVEAYHGTFQPTLDKFNSLSHFGTLQAAEDRIKEKARREKIKTPGRIYQVTLDIKNPFVAKDFAGVHSPTHFAFDLKDQGLISQEEMLAITELAGEPGQVPVLIKKLRELGFDGIAYKNKYEDKGSTSYVILDPSQVVSVKPVEGRQGVAEGYARKLNFDEIYGKYLKVTDNNGDPGKPGFSLVTPLNGDSWNWRERPEFIPLVKKKLNQPGWLGDHKYQQIIDAMAGKQFDPTKHLTKENFADGKKPGRKGLAKRVGVNCKQSVSKLRKIAKNSSGEKQRMAHWCANMKSGRNK